MDRWSLNMRELNSAALTEESNKFNAREKDEEGRVKATEGVGFDFVSDVRIAERRARF